MEDQNRNIQADLQEAVAQAEGRNANSIPMPQMAGEPVFGGQPNGAAVNNGAGFTSVPGGSGQQSFTPNPNSFAPYQGVNGGQQGAPGYQHQQAQYQQPYQDPNVYQGYTGYRGQNAWKPVEPGKGLSIASLICGIVSMLTILIPVVGMGCGIAAIVTAVISRKQAGRMNGMAIAGLICGIGGLVLQLLIYGFAFTVALLSEL